MPSYSFASLVAVVAVAVLTAVQPAQATVSQDTINTCSASFEEPLYEETYTWSATDTATWTFTYTFDGASCSQVPLAGVWLYDNDSGSRYTCSTVPSYFPSSGSLTVTCGLTHAAMLATGDSDWYMYVKYGVKPTYFTREDDFSIESASVSSTVTSSTSTTSTTATATASHAIKRRRREEQAGLVVPSGFGCPDRQKACPAGRKGIWKCVDVWTNLDSCGGCPGEADAQDCSDIPGATHMQCIMGTCVVNQCDRKHHLSQNGTACLPN